MADQVQAHVQTIAHAIEDPGQRLDRRRRNVRDARLESDRRDEITEFYRLERIGKRLPDLEPVAFLARHAIRVLNPLRVRVIE